MKRADRRRVDGVLLLDKPAGLSSNAALQRARRLYAAAKAGHTGTLDPLATGLLPIAFGEATKFAHALLDAPKRYEAVVRLGIATDTGDAEGQVTRTLPVAIDRAAFEAILARFVGPRQQTPPRYAALKHRGRAYYDWAREGIEIPRPPRAIELFSLALRDWRPPDAVVDVHCSKGTYVRVLAEDLGAAAGTCAHLAALRRTATGGFVIDDAVTLETLEAMAPDARLERLLPVDVLVADMPRVDLAPDDVERFRHGVAVAAAGTASGRCVVYGAGELLGLADVDTGVAKPSRLLAEPAREPVSS
ncbi:MAG TPA: tRNA pseudouridine(55) synthase TruB [Steroidobacteraceae bacterium]